VLNRQVGLKIGSMSISLVVLRFEVADDLPLPQGLGYSG